MEEGDWGSESELTDILANANPEELAEAIEEIKKLYPQLETQGTGEKEEKQSIVEYISSKIQIISTKKLENFLMLQVGKLIKALATANTNWEGFASEATEDFLESVDREKAMQIFADYFPNALDESLQDIRMHVVGLMILGKALEYAEDAAETNIENPDSIWNDDIILAFIDWVTPYLNKKSHEVLKKYMLEYPELQQEGKELSASNQVAAKHPSTYRSKKISSMVDNTTMDIAARVKELENQLKTKQRLIRQLKQQLGQANNGQPCSNQIMMLNGAILGAGGSFVLSMLARFFCEPCVEHFEPNSTMALLLAIGGTVGTSTSLYYLQKMPNFRNLLATLVCQTGTQIGNLCSLYQRLAKALKQKEAALPSPWKIFTNTLTPEQIETLSDIDGLLDGEDNINTAAFATIYANLREAYQDAKANKKQAEPKFVTFNLFLHTIKEEQKALFLAAMHYLKAQNTEKN